VHSNTAKLSNISLDHITVKAGTAAHHDLESHLLHYTIQQAKMEHLPKDFFVTSMQFTQDTYRDVYPGVDPTSADLSMAGKVVIITGASGGIGGKVISDC
jgi:FlaA1/EpsC-like NDP-sugar epimerase